MRRNKNFKHFYSLIVIEYDCCRMQWILFLLKLLSSDFRGKKNGNEIMNRRIINGHYINGEIFYSLVHAQYLNCAIWIKLYEKNIFASAYIISSRLQTDTEWAHFVIWSLDDICQEIESIFARAFCLSLKFLLILMQFHLLFELTHTLFTSPKSS